MVWRGDWNTVTLPWVSKAVSNGSRLSRPRPSDSQNVSKSPSSAVVHVVNATGSGSHAAGCRLGNCCLTTSAAANCTASGSCVSGTSATVRPARNASSNSASTRAIRASQSRASAHVASISTNNGPVPARSVCGFSTGPAKPIITAATASIRSNNSHHGVRSACVASSVSPSSSATPGNRRRIGAGGTARRMIHRIGRAISASSSSGAAKPKGPIIHIRRAFPKHQTPIIGHWPQARRCGAYETASR